MLYTGIKGGSSNPISVFSRKFLPAVTKGLPQNLGLLETSSESPESSLRPLRSTCSLQSLTQIKH